MHILRYINKIRIAAKAAKRKNIEFDELKHIVKQLAHHYPHIGDGHGLYNLIKQINKAAYRAKRAGLDFDREHVIDIALNNKKWREIGQKPGNYRIRRFTHDRGYILNNVTIDQQTKNLAERYTKLKPSVRDFDTENQILNEALAGFEQNTPFSQQLFWHYASPERRAEIRKKWLNTYMNNKDARRNAWHKKYGEQN